MKKSHFLAVGVSAAALLASGVGFTVASVYDWSTTAASNSTADPGINWAEGMLPSAVNDSARATMAAIAAWVRDATVVTGGAGNAYTVTSTQAMRSWSPGYFSFVANRANTGTTTISKDGLAPKPMRAVSGVELLSGQILNGGFYIGSYKASTDEVLIAGKLGLLASDNVPVANGTVRSNITGATAVPQDTTLASFFGAAPTGSIPGTSVTPALISGEVRLFNLSSCPPGWAAANGTGGTPDLRGLFVRGVDGGRGIDPGRTLASLQNDDMLAHNHPVTDPGHNHSIPVSTGTILTGTVGVTAAIAAGNTTGSNTTGISIGNTGGTETRPKNIALLYCYAP